MTFVIDLFCGAGGTTTAIFRSGTNMKVVYCINHDPNAIRSHSENYKECKHATEDIRHFNLTDLIAVVAKLRRDYPGCKIAIWASLECTNHSKAKGGVSRDADSRSLANHLFRYIRAIDPDFLWIENVREFMDWGPLRIKEGKKSTKKYSNLAWDEKKEEYVMMPVKELKGTYYDKWVRILKESFGFHFEHQMLNSADYGGVTIRTRYFAQFAKNRDEISFPEPTHAKNPEGGNIFGEKKKWRAVKEVLDLEDEGESIFGRKKDYCEKTLKRIYDGLIKFVAGGKDNFLAMYYSGGGQLRDIDLPGPTVTTKDRVSKVQMCFMSHYYSGGGQLSGIYNPHPSITTVPKSRLTSIKLIDNQYGNSKPQGLDIPAGTILANPKQNLISIHPWIMNPNFNNVGNDINDPSPTILASRKHYYVMNPCIINKNSSTAPAKSIDDPCPTITQRTHYLMNPQWTSKGSSVHKPCFTLIARMDKMPPYLITTEKRDIKVFSYERYTPMKFKIREFMWLYGISDIKMRMLKIPELLQIQGFPKDYKLVGTKTEKKKYIGNSVEVKVGIALFQAIDEAIQYREAC